MCRGRQARAAVKELLRIFRQVHGVVADTLKLAEALDIVVEHVASVSARHVRRQADEVVVHMVGELVDVLLVLVDDLDRVGVVLLEHAHRVHHTRAGETRHGGDGLARARERDGGRGEELFIEQRKLVVDIFAKAHIVLDELARELFKLAAYRQQHDGRNKTEHRVHIRDAAGGKRLVPQGIEHTERVQQHQPHDHEDRTGDVEEDMDHARALGIGLRADGADDGRRHTVADVDADDDGVNGRERQRAGRGNGLQNTDGRRRTLQQERNARAEQESEHRLSRELVEHVGKRLRFRQRAHRRGHAEKAGEEDAEAHRDRADGIGLAGLDRH